MAPVRDLGLLMSAVIDVLTGDFDVQANNSIRSKTAGSGDRSAPPLVSAPTAGELKRGDD